MVTSQKHYKRYVWDETTSSFMYMHDDFDFGRKRISYAGSNADRPHSFIYSSHVDLNIVLITNLSPNDNIFTEYLILACANFYSHLYDYNDWLRRHGRIEHTFHLDLLEDKVMKIERQYGSSKS